MQVIHIDEHVYNVRRDGPWDDGSNAGPVFVRSQIPMERICGSGTHLMPYLPVAWRVFRYDMAGHGRRDVARRSRGRPARSARRLRSGEAPCRLVRRRTDRPGLIVPGAIRAGNSDKV